MHRGLAGAAVVVALTLLVTGCGDGSASKFRADSGTSTDRGGADPSGSPSSGVDPQPFGASELLAGDADPDLPDGEPDEVSVVAEGPLDKSYGSGAVTFAFRNNTDRTIAVVNWTARARAGGNLVATGSSQNATTPALVGPGEIGLDYVYFSSAKRIPRTGATYEFSPDITWLDEAQYGPVPFTVAEENRTGNTIVGSAVNKTRTKASSPYGVTVYCFEGDDLVGQTTGFAEEEGNTKPGGSVSFTVQLYGRGCETYALGVTGLSF